MPALRIAVHGAAGRMGRRVTAVARETDGVTVAAALEYPGSPHLGTDAGELAGVGLLGVPVAAELSADADVLIDFSTPAGFDAAVRLCGDRSLPLVAATTGLTDEQRAALSKLAERVPVLSAPSMSTAVNVAMQLCERAATALRDVPGGCDVEVIERHHRFKEDAPSGTALRFGRVVADVMGQTEHVHGRSGRPGERPHGEIGYHALRVGDDVGQHTVVFGLLGETLEVTVRGQTRDSYARGAVAAAKWLAGKPPGLYGMADVLGLAFP